MSLSVFFLVLFVVSISELLFSLAWLALGIKTLKMEKKNTRPMKGVIALFVLSVAQIAGVFFVTDPSFWLPKAKLATETTYAQIAPKPSAQNKDDVKIMELLAASIKSCVIDLYGTDPGKVSMVVLLGQKDVGASGKKELLSTKKQCEKNLRDDVALLDDENQTKYSSAFDKINSLLNSPLARTQSFTVEERESLGIALSLKDTGMLSAIRKTEQDKKSKAISPATKSAK